MSSKNNSSNSNLSKKLKKILHQNNNNNYNNLSPMNKKLKKFLNSKTFNNEKTAGRINHLSNHSVRTCNKVLVAKGKDCQCLNDKGYPSKNFKQCMKKSKKKCKSYNKCREIFSNSLSGFEPEYNPEHGKILG